MKKQIIYLLAIFSAMLAGTAKGQFSSSDSTCACEKFPYFFCTENAGQQSETAYCTDDPTAPEGAGNPLGPGVAVRDANPFTCIEQASVTDSAYPSANPGDQPGYGYVYNRSTGDWVPGVNLDNNNYPSTGSGAYTVGTTMAPSYAGDPSYLSYKWLQNLGGALRDTSGKGTCVTYNTSCCLTIAFVTDTSFYSDPSRVTHGLSASNTAGYVEPDLGGDCTISCGDHNIYINVTNLFLYGQDSVDFVDDPPDFLLHDYVVDGGTGGIPTRSVNVGAYYDWVENAWNYSPPNIIADNTIDFVSVIMHEMGHWMGLPDRTVICANTGGAPCGTADPNSVMNGTLTYGKETESFTSSDQCWLRKLYCPDEMPKCPTDAVSESVSPSDIDLEQSVPNPTTGGAVIGYSVDRDMQVTMVLYDILGKRIMTLLPPQTVVSGRHTVSISPTDLPSGKYVYSLRAGDAVLSKEMTVVK